MNLTKDKLMYYVYAFANIRSDRLGVQGQFSTPGEALKRGRLHSQMHFTELKMKYEYLAENRPYPVTVLQVMIREVPCDEVNRSIAATDPFFYTERAHA